MQSHILDMEAGNHLDDVPPPSYDESMAAYANSSSTPAYPNSSVSAPVDEKQALREALNQDRSNRVGSPDVMFLTTTTSASIPSVEIAPFMDRTPSTQPPSPTIQSSALESSTSSLSALSTSTSPGRPTRCSSRPPRTASCSSKSSDPQGQHNALRAKTSSCTLSAPTRQASVMSNSSISSYAPATLPYSSSSVSLLDSTMTSSKSNMSSALSLLGDMAGLNIRNSSIAQLFDPLPISFTREPIPGLSYSDFTPCVLYGLSKRLKDGFPSAPPSADVSPHPFATHDVNEVDWQMFLDHLHTASSMSTSTMGKLIASGGAQAKTGAGIVAGMLIPNGKNLVDKIGCSKSNRSDPPAEVIAYWNYSFFHRRHVEITLAQGRVRHSGDLTLPLPDIPHSGQKGKGSVRVVTHGSLSDEEYSDSDQTTKSALQEWMDTKRQCKAEKRVDRQQKKQRRCDGRSSEGEPWRLVVSYWEPIL